MILVGHRGFRKNVHENTFDAFYRAFELKMDFIEFDVQLSRDKILYILHDTSFDRTMDFSGSIGDVLSSEIDKITTLDKKWRVPKLEEVFLYKQMNLDTKTKLMIELKGVNTGKFTSQLIKEHNMEKFAVFSGRYLPEIIDAHNICPSIPICLNITKCQEFSVHDLMNCNSTEDFPIPFSMFSLKSNLLETPNFIIKCHELGVKALCWNFYEYENPNEVLKRMIEWNIDGILLDDPDTVAFCRSLV